MGSDVEMESEGEKEREERRRKKRDRSKSKERDKGRERSRSKGRERSKDREKRKHKKHKKDKKKHKKRDRSSEGDDTANEGGDTPEKKTPTGRDKERDKTPELPEIEKLPGLGKYDSEGEEGEIEEKKLEIERERRKEYVREEEGENKEERKEYQRAGSRDRERKRRKSRSRERKRSGDRGRDRDREGRDEGRENNIRSERENKDREGRDEGRENSFRSERENKDREGRDSSFRSERDNKERDGRDRYRREERSEARDGHEKDGKSEEPGELGGGKEVLSLSIEESNKLRAKLGLKPLNISNIVVEDENSDLPGELIPGDRDKTRHLVPQHWGERDQQKKLVEKLALKRDHRKVKTKLAVVKGLGDSDSEEDDAAKWVERQKKKVKDKEEAEKRAKAMEELDQEFGVQDIVEEGLKEKQQKEYSSRDLRGMRVEHSAEAFGESTTVLTLQDQDILSEKYEDVLVNVNIVDNERHKKSLANIKAGKEGYQAYDQEEVDELTGEVTKKDLLYQYQEELEGVKKDSFTLEGEGEFSEAVSRERELAKIRQKLRQNNAVSLEMPAPKLATDYYTDMEMMAFKKPKKKKKVRKKMLKADDLLAMTQESSLLPTGFGEKQKKRAIRIVDDDQILPDGRLPDPADDHDDLPVVPDMTGVRLDKEKEDDSRAMRALKIARKLTKVKTVDHVAEEVLRDSRENTVEMEEEGGDGAHYSDLVIDQTQEFCRGLGEVGSYEQSGLGETVDKELLDFEKSLESERMRSAVEWSKMEDREEKVKEKEVTRSKRGTWEEVDEEVVEEGRWKEGARRQQRRGGNSSSDNSGGGKAPYRPAILEDEALAATGMGAALKMAMQKGYLDAEEKKVKSTGLVHLKCKNYNIDDKSRDHEEDDRKRRGGGRDRGYQGPTSSFSEKKGYKPEVTLEYVDDTGRAMNAKEAFRFLSHKFHGKGSGKLKTEKRQRKVLEDKLMEKMSSTDTPLNTLSKLQNKTKELATPYLVLSGNKHSMGGHTSLKK